MFHQYVEYTQKKENQMKKVSMNIDEKTDKDYATFIIRVDRKSAAKKFANLFIQIENIDMYGEDEGAISDEDRQLSLVWSPDDELEVIDWDKEGGRDFNNNF